MKGWVVAGAGAAALAGGAAFRAAASTGEPGYRMAGTILLVATGWLLTLALEGQQVAAGLRALEERLSAASQKYGLALERLPDRWAARQRWAAGYVVEGPGKLMVVAACPVSHAAWRGLAARAVDACARSARDTARSLQRRRQAEQSRSPVAYALVVLLRRRASAADADRLRKLGCGLANPEHLPAVLEPLARPEIEGA
ncbi:hypothetical protein U7230_10035 [Carboxydochorda subterranea]|uniref:Uncharacterized protein n=1 Tax=Carboxydichorda subterranea TaxID=3109565 RepID=A0ABZ1BUE2_9FIRM|nr:hypothetical protein [Limnochorda sp. L945t]WRP16435.1 hypothetical protein U7230_10035 [Limnochorda sp. L945t]